MGDSARREVLADSLAKTLLWVTTTPSAMVRTLPFYLLEAGCFLADPNYIIQREYHNSYLLLYTRSGQGTLKTQGVSLSLEPESCVILDCHKPHEYCCSGDDTLYPLLYPAQVQQSMVENPLEFEETLRGILSLAEIGQACGFQEASNFIAHFKKHTGLRPSAYRRIFLQECPPDLIKRNREPSGSLCLMFTVHGFQQLQSGAFLGRG